MSFGFNSATSVPQTEDGPQIAKKGGDKLDAFLWRNTKIAGIVSSVIIVLLFLASLLH
jgi:hypothetical protein